MAKTANMIANYKAGVSAGGAKYTSGVNGTTKDVMALAAAAVQSGKWLQNVTASQSRLLAKLQATPTSYWKTQAGTVGARNYSASATKAGDNYAKVQPQLAQAAQAAEAAVAAQTAPLERVRAAANAMKTAFGKTDLL